MKKNVFSILSIVVILLSFLGGPKTVSSSNGEAQIDITPYIGGLAQLEVVTQYPIQSIVVVGVNQYGNAVTWPEENKVKEFEPGSNVTKVRIDNWWWRFKYDCLLGTCPGFPKPEEIAPYVFIRYESGTIASKRCMDDGSLDDKWSTCQFPVVELPTSSMICDDPVYYGVRHCKNEEDSVETILVDLNDPHVRVQTILSRPNSGSARVECNSVNGNDRDSNSNCPYPYPFETISSMLARSGAAAIINTDYFGCDPKGGPFACGNLIGDHGAEGLAVRNGVRLDGKSLHNDTDGNSLTRTSLAFSKTNRWLIGKPSSEASIVTQGAYFNVVGGGPVIVSDGQAIENNAACNGKDSGIFASHCERPWQSAAGVTGNNILVLATAAKQADALAEFMVQNNQVKTALKLDGGGSAHLAWVDGNGTIQEYDPSGDNRPVAEGLLIFSDKISTSNISKFHIMQEQTIHFPLNIATDYHSLRFDTKWMGSDIVLSLISPSGRIIDRDTILSDVIHEKGPNYETYMVQNSEPGIWQVNLFGADVPAAGEDVTFEFSLTSQIPPLPQLAYVEDGKLILNMGSEERRDARLIESNEINEEFKVKQLTGNLPAEFSVTAFGITEYYKGVTSILANADDGSDTISLESGDVPFTAMAEIHGGSGDDRIQSGDGNDTLSGDEGNDQINAGGGDDTITGGDGVDDLNGQAGSDNISGGAGNDTINGGSDADVLHGDDGDDAILGEAGNDLIYGDAGQDKLFGGAGDDEIYGGADADRMEGGDGADRLFGEGGADEMYGQAGADELHGGPGDDKLYGGEGNDTLNGDEDNDLIEGNEGADKIYGGSGNDRLLGQAGPDFMSGGDGTDLMYGNDGDDQMSGGAGDDYMEGNQGADAMQGDDGQDDLIGGTPAAGTPDGADTLYGGSGHDVLAGDNAAITRPDGIQPANFATDVEGVIIRSVALFDIASTTAQAADGTFAGDKLFGEDGRDILYGQGGDDTISGGTGDDYAEGNAGKDTIAGDAGQDDLIGGTGRINDDPSHGTNGRLDDADTIYGESDTIDGAADGSGADVILGDNGIITRKLDANGAWINTSYNGTVTRQIVLLDVATTSTVVDPNVSAGDRIWGNDNDDILYGQGGEDEIYGGSGDDYIEGNAASDILSGDDGDDDMLGGSGPTANGAPETLVAGLIDASTRTRAVPLGTNPAVNVPLGDVMYGGAGSDVMLGDNGMITRPMDGNGLWKMLNYALFLDTTGYQAPRHPTSGMGTRVTRSVVFVDLAPGQTAGSDLMYGGAGDDDLYGQFDDTAGPVQPAIGDEMFGEAGEDAMVGDLGSIESSVVATATKTIRPPEPFFDDDTFIQNTLLRQVTLLQAAIGGNDRMSGGSGGDWMHAGAGDDLMNGNSGNDRLFGDDGNDAIWGGANHDHLWGGTGNDSLDIKPRLSMLVGNGKNSMGKQTLIPTDPLEWFAYADKDNFQDIDYIYGGWGQDAMQADIGDTGPVPGDRLIDWTGGYNAYYLCPGLYGERVVTRNHSPKIVDFLQALAAGDGAIDPTTVNSSGYGEVGMVFSADIRFNANPAHPDNPGHYTCP